MDKKMVVNEKEYEILKLLGKGKGGYSYLASDGTQRYVLKQIHHEPCDYYQFGDKLQSERDAYRWLKQIGIRMPPPGSVTVTLQYRPESLPSSCPNLRRCSSPRRSTSTSSFRVTFPLS